MSRLLVHLDRTAAARALVLAACLGPLAAFAGATAVCDPPGPPPRFGCQWSTETCEWVCAVCDPFGAPPRSSCTWNGDVCNWICPGYTGVEVTVQTLHGPTAGATVYVKLSSLCTATGAGAFCGGSFPVQPGMSIAAKCQAIADAVTNNCAAAGYAVAANDCRDSGSFTATDAGCSDTEFALGVSNDPGDFDETDQRPLPDGESESVTGVCGPQPGIVQDVRIQKMNGGLDLQLTWDAAAHAQSYTVFEDAAPGGSFSAVAGMAPDGTPTLSIPTPGGSTFYLVAGNNSVCGTGAKD